VKPARRYRFALSRQSVRRLHQLREETGYTAANEFRRLVYCLADDKRPKFEVSGRRTSYTYSVTMTAEQYAGLVIVAARYGVPKECIGEMVLSYYPKDY